MTTETGKSVSLPLGVVVRKAPGVTGWTEWSWKAVAVLPGAAQVSWSEMRREGKAVEYHAGTVQLTLWAAEAEAYLANLADTVPSIYVVFREEDSDGFPLELTLATASPYEGQDYADNGTDIVEKVPMPPGLVAWIRDFALMHHKPETFVKRRRANKRVDLSEDGKGDPRIRQTSDVYRAPGRRVLH